MKNADDFKQHYDTFVSVMTEVELGFIVNYTRENDILKM